MSIRDTSKESFENFRTLLPGDHFGEIGIIYNCPRTATVISDGYSTFARLSKDNYKLLLAEVPELETEFKSYILQMYNDEKTKLWAFEALK